MEVEASHAPEPVVENGPPKGPQTPPSKRTKVKRGSHDKVDPSLQNEFKEDDFIFENDDVHFEPPAEGTPAAEALQANADIKVTRLEKGIRRIKGIKHPKAKNITKFMKRGKNKSKAFSRNFKGKVIDGVHELYTITAGMMLGLRVAVGRSNTTSVQDLLLGDFSYVEKISFPPHGNNQPPFRTPPHQLAHTFKFKTYAPLVFSKLRDFFDIDSVNYMLSVCGNYNYLEFISNSKSGQFFFYSHDGRYMIKTQTNEENKFMKRILPHYYRYVTENPHTFLVRIYGMHRVKMYHLHRKTHFVIMQSVFDTPEPIQKIYDLKGSVLGRDASQKERENGGVLKDNDLIADGVKLQLGPKRQAILDQLEKDSNFLAEMNIMDYSVLLGIHDRRTRTRTQSDPEHGLVSPPRNSIGSMPKRRSVLPFRLNEKEASSMTVMDENVPSSPDNDNVLASPRTSTKKRSSTFDSKENSKPAAAIKMTASVDLSVSDIAVDDEYSEEEEEEEEEGLDEDDDEESEDEEEDSEDEDAGDSDLDGAVASDDDSRGEASDLHQNLRGEVTTVSGGGSDGDGRDLTGINLTAVGKKTVLGVKPPAKSLGDGSSIQSLSVHATVGSITAGSHTDVSAESSGSEDNNDDEDGVGFSGEEGKSISKLFKDNVDLSAVASAGNRLSQGMGAASPSPGRPAMGQMSRNTTFGPGSTRNHPWTGRYDGGINCRLPDGTRGDYIYYVGVIDILQQYNASKRFETVFKGFAHDKSKISSVDSVSYAKRFVKFMTDNTV